jgi:hypothetical protein
MNSGGHGRDSILRPVCNFRTLGRHFNRGTLGLRRPSVSVSRRRIISGGGRVDFRPLSSQAIGDNARHSDVILTKETIGRNS